MNWVLIKLRMRWKLIKLKEFFLGSPYDCYCQGCCNKNHYYHPSLIGLVGAYIGVSIMLGIEEEVLAE